MVVRETALKKGQQSGKFLLTANDIKPPYSAVAVEVNLPATAADK
jgi:hypothetical protein